VHVQREQIQDDACFHIAGALMKNAGCVLHKKHPWHRTVTLWENASACLLCVSVPACIMQKPLTRTYITHC